MKKDQLKINKFLELLPDNSMKRIFYSLSCSNMIRHEDAYLIDDYLEYIREFNLLFDDKKLQEYHSAFYESLDILDTFTMRHFFGNNPSNGMYILYDDRFIINYPEKYEKFEKELKILVGKVENEYGVFRKSLEEHILQDENIDAKEIKKEKEFWVTKENDRYFYDDAPVHVKSKKAQYLIIFDVTFSLKPEGGDIKYSDIIRLCKKRNLNHLKVSSVQKALCGESADFFRYIKDIKQDNPYGIHLFESLQDKKHIRFNNKK